MKRYLVTYYYYAQGMAKPDTCHYHAIIAGGPAEAVTAVIGLMEEADTPFLRSCLTAEEVMDDGSNAVPVPGTYNIEIKTPVEEDQRLFYVTRINNQKATLRYGQWYPFEEKFWPFGQYDSSTLADGVQVLFLAREYSQQKGQFIHLLTPLRTKIEGGEHPGKTRAYVGFMLVSPSSAMASLLIPKDFGKDLL